jgi:hypothetical protein
MKKVNLFIFILFFLLINCSKLEKIDPKKVITEAKIISCKDVLKDYNYHFQIYPEILKGDFIKGKENHYYVLAKINNVLLAKLTENDVFKLNYILNENIYSLYGKFLNDWTFYNSKNEMIFVNHYIVIKRINEIDEVLFGPLSEKPKKMKISIENSKNYPNLPAPIYEFN